MELGHYSEISASWNVHLQLSSVAGWPGDDGENIAPVSCTMASFVPAQRYP